MELLEQIEFVSNPEHITLKFNDFAPKKITLIRLCVDYVKMNDDDLFKKHKYDIARFSTAKPINWKKQRIPEFNKLDQNTKVSVKLKPLENMPDTVPNWMEQVKLSGIFWLLKIFNNEETISLGQVLDIYQGLNNLDKFMSAKTRMEVEYKCGIWFSAMMNFFRDVYRKENSIKVYIK